MPGAGGIQRLTRAVGRHGDEDAAHRKPVSTAREAYEMGLVSEVSCRREVLDER